MGLSRSARIIILLVIDVLFFFVELIVGSYPLIMLSHKPNALQGMPLDLLLLSQIASICSSMSSSTITLSRNLLRLSN